MANEQAIDVKNLVKNFGQIRAVQGLSFAVKTGEIYGLIGPNGAGKTTTLRILATLLKPSSGSAKIFGLDVVKEAQEVRKIISYLPEDAGAYKNLSGGEYLEFMAKFYSSSRDEIQEMVETASKISGLSSRLKDKVKTYSKGMNRRLLIARALMTKPKLAILDEPTSGLDVVHAFHVRRIIREYVVEKRLTVLLSSHNMLEVEFLCDRVALINEGKIVMEGTPEQVKSTYNAGNLEEAFMEATKIG
ncbi:MAG: ABC transporter ATP-binding protein [Nitrososphaerota archaeon]|nr:ABC transporter ATP-binding protein [Candidatus Bathyarchaeota archaeon]MDW8048507.1 ABC transporter ATP-binding protein [Nitrososphaerota archaeon]